MMSLNWFQCFVQDRRGENSCGSQHSLTKLSEGREKARFSLFLHRTEVRLFTALVTGLLLTVSHFTAVQATTFIINNIADQGDANIGDGTCATTSGVCTLRAAIQEANARSGPNTITLPAGTYDIDGPLTLGASGSWTSLVGVDSRSSVIRRSANDFTMITMSSLSALRRLTVDGNTAPPPGTRPGMQQRAGVLCHGLSNANIEGCDFEDLIVKNNLGQGISFQYAANARLRNVTVSGNWERGINISAFSHRILASDIRGSNNLNSDIVIGWGSHSNVISNCVLDLTSNTGLWLAQDVHDNNISNVRIHSPHSTAYQGIFIANAYRNHLDNVSISGFPLGVLLRSDSVTCTTYGPPELWDEDTRDNIISNINVDGRANATAGIQFDAYVTSTTNVAPGVLPGCGFKKVVSNIVSNVTIDNVTNGVKANSAQQGTTDVTNNTIATGVFHNISGRGPQGTPLVYDWGNQTGNIVK